MRAAREKLDLNEKEHPPLSFPGGWPVSYKGASIILQIGILRPADSGLPRNHSGEFQEQAKFPSTGADFTLKSKRQSKLSGDSLLRVYEAGRKSTK